MESTSKTGIDVAKMKSTRAKIESTFSKWDRLGRNIIDVAKMDSTLQEYNQRFKNSIHFTENEIDFTKIELMPQN